MDPPMMAARAGGKKDNMDDRADACRTGIDGLRIACTFHCIRVTGGRPNENGFGT